MKKKIIKIQIDFIILRNFKKFISSYIIVKIIDRKIKR
ncbi:conserved hypothetical protein [Peptoniphilus harei ACS-146-V-Sch2b]|uniref:Uncharacterized protein n=1 Tax=Peptoniphilus harei ACS-146-V-Sch2b TaxID=908338 RepID=E4KZP5_9FIRM|nr:conserved hypothetical protein [Peptoniphilus harei ACS-146-V-Sch2b]